MNVLFNYTFTNVSEEDGVYESNGKLLPKMYNFGTWLYMDEITKDYGDGGCVLWRTKLAAAVTKNKNFCKNTIDINSKYTLNIKIKVIKPLNDNISVGFFRSTGDFNVLNEGPLKGAGPFTKIGNGNRINEESIIKTVEIPCDKVTDDFFNVEVSVDGSYIYERMQENLENEPVYVGFMNFKHRQETDDRYVAISEITVSKEISEIVYGGIDFYGLSSVDESISLVAKFYHKTKGSLIKLNNENFRISTFTLALLNTIDLQLELINNNDGTSVIIKGFKKEYVYDEITITPLLLCNTLSGENEALFGEPISFSLEKIYMNYVSNNKKIKKEIMEWFTPQERSQICLFNDKPVNENFLGFGALYYPWIYFKDEDGRNYTEEEAENELDRLKLSGVKIARATVFVSENWYNEETNTWSFQDDEFKALVRSFMGISERQVDIMLNFEWGNSINFGPVFANSELAKYPFDKQCEIFAMFVRDFVMALKNNGVKTVKYITFFSEPANGIPNGFESDAGKELLVRYDKCVGAVHNTLYEAGIRQDYKLVLGNVALGTEIWNYTYQIFEPICNVLKTYADEWSYHNYNRYSTLISNTALPYENMMACVNEDIIQKTGVKANDVWIDEYNALDRNNTWFEFRNFTKWNPIHIIAGMVANVNVGYKTILNWTFINTLWVGSHANAKDNWKDGHHCWGLIPHPHQDKRPYNSFYAYQIVASHFTDGKTFRGDNIIESGLCCCACENADGSFTIVVVNSNIFTSPFELKLSMPLENVTFKRYLFDASKEYRSEDNSVITFDKKIKNVTDKLRDVLPGGSIAVYTTMP